MKANKIKSIIKAAVTITITTLTTLAISCQPATAKKLDFSDGSNYYQPTISNSVNGKYYPLTGIVTSVIPKDARTDIVTFVCSNGNMFSFSAPATDYWDKEDIVSCIMDNNGTGNTVYDDKVMSALYSGSTRQLDNQYRSITRKGSK